MFIDCGNNLRFLNSFIRSYAAVKIIVLSKFKKRVNSFEKSALNSKTFSYLVGVCMRMALVEAMYKEEKPFLIFDDPFVNLDDNNIKGAMKLLDEIAKNYQVIYFTCSESRIHN